MSWYGDSERHREAKLKSLLKKKNEKSDERIVRLVIPPKVKSGKTSIDIRSDEWKTEPQ